MYVYISVKVPNSVIITMYHTICDLTKIRLQTIIELMISWFYIINQFVSIYDYSRPLTRLRELISTPSEVCYNDTIKFSIDMYFMCKYGRKSKYLPYSFLC